MPASSSGRRSATWRWPSRRRAGSGSGPGTSSARRAWSRCHPPAGRDSPAANAGSSGTARWRRTVSTAPAQTAWCCARPARHSPGVAAAAARAARPAQRTSRPRPVRPTARWGPHPAAATASPACPAASCGGDPAPSTLPPAARRSPRSARPVRCRCRPPAARPGFRAGSGVWWRLRPAGSGPAAASRSG